MLLLGAEIALLTPVNTLCNLILLAYWYYPFKQVELELQTDIQISHIIYTSMTNNQLQLETRINQSRYPTFYKKQKKTLN
jgi:hypothetical protein